MISHRLINVYISLIPLMIFIHADLPNKASEITLKSIKEARENSNGFFGYLALPFKKTYAFFKNIIFGESWEYEAKNVAVFAYKGGRRYMEDRFFIDEDFKGTGVSVYAIFDGHAGDFSAQYAVDNLMKSLKEKIIKLKEHISPDKSLKNKYMENDTIKYLDLLNDEILITEEKLQKILATEEIREILKKKKKSVDVIKNYTDDDGNINKEKLINDRIISEEELQQRRQQQQHLDLSGTTALIAIIEKKQLFIANVGDSRIVMGKTDNTAKRLTHDHKPSEWREQRRIKEKIGAIRYAQEVVKDEYGIVRVDGLSVSRTLGDLEAKYFGNIVSTPEVFQYDLLKMQSKFLIFASDGLWDEFEDEDAATFIKKRYNEELFGAKSIALAVQKRQKKQNIDADNITVIILKT